MHMLELEKIIKRLLAIIERLDTSDTWNIDNTEYIGLHEPRHESKNTLRYSLHNSPTTAVVMVDLLRLRVFPESITDLFPFTINDYFDQHSRGITPEVEITMSLELLRVSSFCTFPTDIHISVIRLAKNGFYHTGRGKETKCYSCGVIYRDWISGDDPIAVHKRISPFCTLVTTYDYETTMNRERHLQLDPMSSTVQLHRNSENTSEALTLTRSVHNEPVVAASTNSVNSFSHRTSVANEQPEITSTRAQALTNNVVQTKFYGIEQFSDSNQCQLKHDSVSLGINVKKPKYPTYASLQVRVRSYQGWPSYLDLTPQQMALAGFLYTGYSDYTTCFFCGGILRNWEGSNDPWVEHARWFPQCEYVKQSKGEKFIIAVLQRQEEMEESSEPSFSNSNLPHNVTIFSQGNSQNDIDNQINSVAARSVLGMGFTTNQVLNALQRINERSQGIRNISAVDLMQVLKEDNVSLNVNTDDHLNDTLIAVLLEENRQLREQRLCKICLDVDATITFLPCGHMVCCSDCAPTLRKCPTCSKLINGTVNKPKIK